MALTLQRLIQIAEKLTVIGSGLSKTAWVVPKGRGIMPVSVQL